MTGSTPIQKAIISIDRAELLPSCISDLLNEYYSNDKPLVQALLSCLSETQPFVVNASIAKELKHIYGNALSVNSLSSEYLDPLGVCVTYRWVMMTSDEDSYIQLSNLVKLRRANPVYANGSWCIFLITKKPKYIAQAASPHFAAVYKNIQSIIRESIDPSLYYDNTPEWHDVMQYLVETDKSSYLLLPPSVHFRTIVNPAFKLSFGKKLVARLDSTSALASGSIALIDKTLSINENTHIFYQVLSDKAVVCYQNRRFALICARPNPFKFNLHKASYSQEKEALIVQVLQLVLGTTDISTKNKLWTSLDIDQGAADSLVACSEVISSGYYREFCIHELKEQPRLHRKQWETFIIAKSIREHFNLTNKKGLGFGVGQELLPEYFASKGSLVMATDAPVETGKCWESTDEWTDSIDGCYGGRYLDKESFSSYCSFKSLDMNQYDQIDDGMDFHWSSCVIEHLGGKQKTFQFLLASALKLNSGGIAVHTTELTPLPSSLGLDHSECCIFTMSDLRFFAEYLDKETASQCKMRPVVAPTNLTPHDFFVDLPPYNNDMHLVLDLMGIPTTSAAIIIEKS